VVRFSNPARCREGWYVCVQTIIEARLGRVANMLTHRNGGGRGQPAQWREVIARNPDNRAAFLTVDRAESVAAIVGVFRPPGFEGLICGGLPRVAHLRILTACISSDATAPLSDDSYAQIVRAGPKRKRRKRCRYHGSNRRVLAVQMKRVLGYHRPLWLPPMRFPHCPSFRWARR
jgi:hypothetical protein